MRNLSEELTEFNLQRYQIEGILKWVNTLTNKDLEDNGSKHAFFPPGDGDCEEFIEPTRDERIQAWVELNIYKYRSQESGKLNLVRDIWHKFGITLVECKSYIDKNW